MDTLFAMNKAGNSSRDYTFCQLFATDKGFLCGPYEVKVWSHKSCQHFAKEFGAPEATIYDAAM